MIALIAIEVIYGTTCPLSKHRKIGQTIINVIVAISTIGAVACIVQFAKRHKERLAGHQPLLKMGAFKLVLVLQVIQSIVFTVLSHTDVFIPSAPLHVSYNDLAEGLPMVLFAWELVVASIIFLWAFGFGRFRAEARSGSPSAGGPFTALLATVNPSDIWQASVLAIRRPSGTITKGKDDEK